LFFRQDTGEGAALTDNAFDPDLTVVKLDKFFGDIQTKAGTG
jgi:hypothetical protein